MVLPLLGLLGLGVGVAAQPHLENRRNRIRGEYQGGLPGVDSADPAVVRQALFRGGILSGPELQGDVRGAFEGVQQRATSRANARTAAGPAHARVALSREQWLAETEQARARSAMLAKKFGIAPELLGPGSAMETSLLGATANDASNRVLGQNAATPAQLATLQAQENERAREQHAAELAAQREYEDTLQSQINIDEDITAASKALDAAQFRSTRWQDAEGQQAQQQINRVMNVLQSDFFAEEMRRTDAPAAEELEALKELFPRVEPRYWSDAQRTAVQTALNLAQDSIRRRALQDSDRFQGRQPRNYRAITNLPPVAGSESLDTRNNNVGGSNWSSP